MNARWFELTRSEAVVCERVAQAVRTKAKMPGLGDYLYTFGHKASKTLEAIALLQEKSLWEPAQALVRVLVELRFDFDCLVDLIEKDPRHVVERLADSMILEKIKQARMSDFLGFGKKSKENTIKRFIKIENEISSRYKPKDLKAIKQFGFTGVSIEKRATIHGNQAIYNTIYRNFSRNVHSTDFAEQIICDGKRLGKKIRNALFDSRNAAAITMAISSAGRIVTTLNHKYKCGEDITLHRLAETFNSLR